MDNTGKQKTDKERIEELERDLLNLVCRIHRDGGHYIAKYGEAKAIADADTVVAQNNADLDALQADNARLREALEYCVTQVGELATVPGIASALLLPLPGLDFGMDWRIWPAR